MKAKKRLCKMIAVRPPEYFPGLSYFGLMDHVDRFVLADTFQYSRQSFQNRTKIRTPDRWQWISIPLKGRQHGLRIHEVEIDCSISWTGKHWRALCFNYRKTPYFDFYEDTFRAFFESPWKTLGDTTIGSIVLIHRLLGISSTLLQASKIDSRPGSLAGILDSIPNDTYVASEEVVEYDRKDRPVLSVMHYQAPRYRQNFAGFEEGMSTLDLLFNYGPETRSIIRQSTRIPG